jgi:hypothetical protein
MGNSIFLGGYFTGVNGQPRTFIAQVDSVNGVPGNWNAGIDSTSFLDGVYSIATSGDTTYVGGQFSSVRGQPRTNFAAFTTVAAGPLPVHLVSFTAKAQWVSSLWKVTCEWSTASEQNGSHFIVERSSDRKNYSALGKVNTKGNSSSLSAYSFSDPSPLQGISYYRLKQVDQDGKYSYSPIAAVTINTKEMVVLLYPNPVRDIANLLITASQREQVSYSIIDARGQEVKRGTYSLQNGSNTFDVNLTEFLKGMYTLTLKGDHVSTQIKFIKDYYKGYKV